MLSHREILEIDKCESPREEPDLLQWKPSQWKRPEDVKVLLREDDVCTPGQPVVIVNSLQLNYHDAATMCKNIGGKINMC